MTFDDGTWAMYTIGVLSLAMSTITVVSIRKGRQTMTEFAARRMGGFAAGAAAVGGGLIAIRAAGSRIDAAGQYLLDLAFVAGVMVAALAMQHLGAQRAAEYVNGASHTDRIAPRMEIAPGHRMAWSSTLSSRWLLAPALAVLLLAPLTLLVAEAPFWILTGVVASGIGALAFSSIRVTADSSGLRVRYGFLPWPTTHVRIDQIAEASVIDLNPIEWGGWGYRGSRKVIGQAAVVLRRGPALRLDLHDGSVFAVTIDDPVTPAALINGQLARPESASSSSGA